jgi:hypothetical protein
VDLGKQGAATPSQPTSSSSLFSTQRPPNLFKTKTKQSLSGKELINTVEFGLSGIDEAEGRFLQVSGLRIWHKGANLLALHLLKPDGTSPDPVSRDGKYPVATLDFLAAGGDGFADLKKGATLLAQGDRIDELLFESMVDAMPNAVRLSFSCAFVSFFLLVAWGGGILFVIQVEKNPVASDAPYALTHFQQTPS